MAFVTRVNNEGDYDPFYEIMGLVTLEDVIEELIQAEIMDETDVFTDNRSKRRRQDKSKRQDFSMFAERRENQRIHISPQLTLAAYQYLSTSLEQFRPDAISEQTLRRLLNQDVFRHVKKNKVCIYYCSFECYVVCCIIVLFCVVVNILFVCLFFWFQVLFEHVLIDFLILFFFSFVY